MGRPFPAWLAAALLVAACDRAEQASVNRQQAAAAPAAATTSSASSLPALTGRVVDQAELLTPAEETQLAERLAALEARTTDQFVVVTVVSLDGRTVEDYSELLANRWGLGQADKDNGVLLLVAPNDRRTRIGLGYGLEQIISHEQAQQILDRDLLPAFRERKWRDGIEAAVESISALLIENENVPRRRTR